MPRSEAFARILEDVCRAQGWRLMPGGVEVPCPDERHQVVGLEMFDNGPEQLVRMFTVIGPTASLPSERLLLALRVNATLAHGALAVRDGELVMVETLLVEEADAEELESSMRYLAETADRYEKLLFGTDDH